MSGHLRSARERLNALRDHLTPVVYDALEAELNDVADRWVASVKDLANTRSKDATNLLGMTEDGLLDLERGIEEFNRRAGTGLVSPRDLAHELDGIRAELRAAEARLTQADAAIETVGTIDRDRIAYADELLARTPALAPQFSF